MQIDLLVAKACTSKTESWSTSLLRTVHVLLKNQQQEILQWLQEWRKTSYLADFIRREDGAFSKFGLTLSVFLFSSLFEFGDPTSTLQQSFEENLRIGMCVFGTSHERQKRPFGWNGPMIQC